MRTKVTFSAFPESQTNPFGLENYGDGAQDSLVSMLTLDLPRVQLSDSIVNSLGAGKNPSCVIGCPLTSLSNCLLIALYYKQSFVTDYFDKIQVTPTTLFQIKSNKTYSWLLQQIGQLIRYIGSLTEKCLTYMCFDLLWDSVLFSTSVNHIQGKKSYSNDSSNSDKIVCATWVPLLIATIVYLPQKQHQDVFLLLNILWDNPFFVIRNFKRDVFFGLVFFTINRSRECIWFTHSKAFENLLDVLLYKKFPVARSLSLQKNTSVKNPAAPAVGNCIPVECNGRHIISNKLCFSSFH